MKIRLLSLALCLVSLSGCASYRGLIPDKDAHFKAVSIEVVTPWGHTTFKADEIDTTAKGLTALPAPAK